jgi:hypothetical protein
MKAAAGNFNDPQGPCPGENELIAHYRGGSDPAIRERIESHLVQCDACRQNLLDVRDFFDPPREGEAPITERDAEREWRLIWPRTGAGKKQPIGGRLYQSRAALALAASLVLALALSLGWSLRLQQRARQEQAAWQQRLRHIEEENRKLVAELQLPRVNTPIYDAFSDQSLARSAGRGVMNRIDVPAASPVTLLLNGAGLRDFADYAIEIVDKQDRRIWRTEGIKRGSHGNFVITLGADFLGDGEYRFRLLGKTSSGYQKAADYTISFRKLQ